jgi:hypothetical protein
MHELLLYLVSRSPSVSHSVSQANVHKKLYDFLQEFRDGKPEGSVISTQTADSLCTNDKQVWRTIRKELEDIGITIAAFNANKAFIFEWFMDAISSGAFEERLWDDSSTRGILSSLAHTRF